MIRNRLLPISFRQLPTALFHGLTVSLIVAASVVQPIMAVSAEQRTIFNHSISYFNVKSCYSNSDDTSDSTGSTDDGGGAPANTVESWLNKYGQWAFDDGKKYGVPYELILAQGALESGWGTSYNARKLHNFFGITRTSSQPGEGRWRSFESDRKGWEGFAIYLTQSGYYNDALSKYSHDPYKLVQAIQPIYAPDSDGNVGYVAKVSSILNSIIKYVKDNNKWPPSSEVQYDAAPPDSDSGNSTDSSGDDSDGMCTCTTAAGSGTDTGVDESGESSNADKIFKALTTHNFNKNQGRPLNDVQASAVLGNLKQESGIQPVDSNKNQGSHKGIAQWDNGRWSKIDDPKDNLDNQIKLLIKEMDSDNSPTDDFWEASSSDDIEKATKAFDDGFERSGGSMLNKRIEYAKDFYTKYRGKAGNTDCSGGALNGSIVQIAKEMGSWGQTSTCYDWSGGHTSQEDTDKRIEHKFSDGYGVDCSGFASAVIYKATGIWRSWDTQGFCNDKENFKEVSVSEAQPGDLAVTCDQHVEIILKPNGDGTADTAGSRGVPGARRGNGDGCGQNIGPALHTGYNLNGKHILRYIGQGADKAASGQ